MNILTNQAVELIIRLSYTKIHLFVRPSVLPSIHHLPIHFHRPAQCHRGTGAYPICHLTRGSVHPALVSHVSDQSEFLPHNVGFFNLYYTFPARSNAIEKMAKSVVSTL